ncbi:axin, partial [Brachionus plicatilis]
MSQHNDLDSLLQNDSGRKLFALFLKDFNNSSDNLLTLYLICSCFHNQRVDDRHRIKQILEKTYQACFVKNQLPYLNEELKQKLCDSLKKSTYNETIFKAVKNEIKKILENEYFPLFLKSKIYHDNLAGAITTSDTKTYQFEEFLGDQTKCGQRAKTNKTTSSASIGHHKKVLKNSSHLSASTRSINQLNDSTLSLNVRPSRSFMPPNPYTVITKPVTVSCQDSEIQSVVSHDDRSSKFDKNIKKNLMANKHVSVNMPEFQSDATVMLKTSMCKKSQIPVSESDPKKFFNLVAAKLEAHLLAHTGDQKLKKRSLSNSNLHTNDEANDQLDEHLDRVYNGAQSPKMCVKKSHFKPNVSLKMKNLSLGQALKNQKSHHFYQLTSTSKEVDIDSQHNQQSAVQSSVDSGVSTRSVASIERVNDWLVNSAHKNPEPAKIKKIEEEQDVSVKTTVAYYLPGEDLAYISTFNGRDLTLAQFKQLITKKGNFRYFFKTKSDLLDEECVVFQE